MQSSDLREGACGARTLRPQAAWMPNSSPNRRWISSRVTVRFDGTLAATWRLKNQSPEIKASLQRMRERGEVSPVDLRAARRLYQRACDAGEPVACAHLGVLHSRGAGGEVDLASGRTKVRPADTLANLADAVRLVRPLANVNLIRTWTGIEGKTPDGYPIIGPSATTPGLFHAIGFSGHGFKLSPTIGRGLAELAMQGKSTSIDMSVLRFTRFADDDMLSSAYGASVFA